MGEKSLLFKVGGKFLSLPVRDIEEIVLYKKPTEVPGTGVKGGFFTHRGRVIPVFEIYPFISDKSGVEEGKDRKIIIIKYKDREVGIAVDEVVDIIEEGAESEAPADEDLFDAVGKFGENTVLFLNEEQLIKRMGGFA